MAENSPLVSVLMTAYNREKYIGDAIESVLQSSYKNFELIIVDDRSTDNTVEIANKFALEDSRIKVFMNEQNLTDYSNRNKAASYAKGKYLKYLDSDDLIYPYGLEVFVNAMESNPSVALGLTSLNASPAVPFPILLNPSETYNKHFFQSGVLDFGPSGSIIVREVFEKLNGFSGKNYIGDFELWLKIASTYPILELPPSLVFWRRHGNQEYGYEDIEHPHHALLLQVFKDNLLGINCPLSKTQATEIIQKHKRMLSRYILRYMLKTGNFKKAYKSARNLGLSVYDLI